MKSNVMVAVAFVFLMLFSMGMTAGFVNGASAPDRDPYSLFVVVKDVDGNPVGNATVTIKDVTNGNEVSVITTAEGYIGIVLTQSLDAHDGDTIKVTVTKGDLSKTAQFEINADDGYKYLELTLEKTTTDEGRMFEGEFLGISYTNWMIILVVFAIIGIAGYMYYQKKNEF